jgi:O-antigen/teichoic acid export membrane protein
VGNILAFLAALGGGMITARALGPSGRGALALLYTTPDLIVSLVLMGIVQTNVCFVSNGTLPPGRMIGVSVRVALLQTLAGLALFTATALFFREQFLGDSGVLLMVLSASLIPLGILQAHWSSLLSALRLFGQLAFTRALAPFLLMAGYFLLLVVFRFGVGGGLTAVLVSWLIVILVMLWNLRSGARRKSDRGEDGNGELCEGFWKRYLTYGAKLHASALIWYIFIRVDIYMLSSMLGLDAVGFYSLASSLAEKLWLVSVSANTVLLPSLAAIADPVARAGMAARASRQLTAVLLPFVIIGVLFGRPLIVLLYGAEFEPSAMPFLILLGSTLVQAHRSMTASYFESSNLALVNVATRGAAFLLKIVLNLLLIPAMLIQGAAFSSLVAYSFEWVLGTMVFLRRTGLPWRDTIPGSADVATVLSKLKDLIPAMLQGSSRSPGPPTGPDGGPQE